MPEIKSQFTGGKMNKDLDERLIPKGEYRDAMNIQVSTSEGSNVGAVENILGNNLGCGGSANTSIPTNAAVVGSIADNKNDSLYWFISGQEFDPSDIVQNSLDATGNYISTASMKDMIFRKGEFRCEPVFVDIFAFSQPTTVTSASTELNGVSLEVLEHIQPGWTITGVTEEGVETQPSTVVSLGSVENNFLYAEFESTPVSTPTTIISFVGSNPIAVANSIMIPVFPLFADGTGAGNSNGYAQVIGNKVYIDGFTGSLSELIGDNIEILPYSGYSQEFEIINAQYLNINYSGGFGSQVIELTLNGNLAFFNDSNGNSILDQPTFIQGTSDHPHVTSSGGATIDALLTSSNMLNIDTATGELVFSTDPLLGGIDLSTAGFSVDDTVYLDGAQYEINSIDTVNNSITLKDILNNVLYSGWQVGGLHYGVPQPTGGTILFQSQLGITLDSPLNLSSGAFTYLLYRGPRTLDFNHNKNITAINIIDDMLFWTDSYNEPKKINITRSVDGSNILGNPGFEHTRLINKHQDIGIYNNVFVREEHITVIKKAPLTAPNINYSTSSRPGSLISGSSVTFTANLAASNSVVGANIEIVAGLDTYDFEIGDTILLSENINELESSNSVVRLEIITINGFQYFCKMLTLPPSGNLSFDYANTLWFARLEENGGLLFERKLPRFAYRYKYIDNEYSSFSPFTNVAFIPGGFNYEPIKAYNTAMTNTIRTLAITDFVSESIPKDVKSIDILYKNDNSTTVYVIDTVSNKDQPLGSVNSWNSTGSSSAGGAAKGFYSITSENISQALPSSQSLRSWDNVPKKAVAQEVTGNRIIYGNYTQGYSITDNQGRNISPDILTRLVSETNPGGGNLAKKSIKSLRNYEVGVVWGDKYGRETPVITSRSGSIVVPKTKSKNSNHLNVSLNDSPSWSDYYRFYVKETSNEYYNLAVDRVYDAGDGNVWVSFPSVDRNKIDEDTYIILKKGADSEELVAEEGRYKVVAIENEAPDYVKTDFDLIVRTNQDASRPSHSCNLWGGVNSTDVFDAQGNTTSIGTGCSIFDGVGFISPPKIGRKSFSINSQRWTKSYSIPNNMGLPDLIGLFEEVTSNSDLLNNEFFVSFTKEVPTNSGETIITAGEKYRVISIILEDEDDDADYVIRLDKPIGVQDEWVCQDTGQASGGSSLMDDNIHVLFWQRSTRNKPEFDGRFFVKILNDSVAQQNLSYNSAIASSRWAVDTTIPVFSLEETNLDNSIYNAQSGDNEFSFSITSINSTSTYSGTNSAYGSFNNILQWTNALKFGSTSNPIRSAWFIDKTTFASQYNEQADNYVVEFSPTGSTFHESCDVTSTLDLRWRSTGVLKTAAEMDSSSFHPGFDITNIEEDVGRGLSYGRVGMKGLHEDSSGSHYIDLAFGGIKPSNGSQAVPSLSHIFDVGSLSNTYHDDQYKVVSNLKPNSRFRLLGCEAIFKIKQVNKYTLFNYSGKATVRDHDNDGNQCINYKNENDRNQLAVLGVYHNKRVTYRIRYELDDTISSATTDNQGNPLTLVNAQTDTDSNVGTIDATNAGTIQFLKEFNYEGENKISENPAVFETEPKEDVGLDLYYEASASLPVFPLTNKNKYLFIPIGTVIVPPIGSVFPQGIFVAAWNNLTPGSLRLVTLSSAITPEQYDILYGDNGFVQFLRDDGTYVTATLSQPPSVITSNVFELRITPNNEFGLNWHNCWSFNNGVESNRIGDTFNKPYLSNGATLSTTVKDGVEEEVRSYGLIYSGIYNSNSGVNSLNQFIAAEKITKDINPTYGSIQKLHAGWGQNGSLVVLCEDRVLNVLANKDALFNADGNPQLTATDKVLGSATPYAGEYGISKNPESFASKSYRIYFTDKVRGAVLRLSRDGITPISNAGMKDWFKDNLKLNNKLIGSFDDLKDEYNITLGQTNDSLLYSNGATVSFKEDVKGWVSFKSFVPEGAISCANQYYTFKSGLAWKHHDENQDRNTFYKTTANDGFTASSVDVVLNDEPGIVKTFHTLNYEGSQSKVNAFNNYDVNYAGSVVTDFNVYSNEYYNINSKPGWKVEYVETDKEKGSVNEFIEKEGKWFNYIRGKVGSVMDPSSNVTGGFDNADFSFQGLGSLSETPTTANITGCIDNSTFVHTNGVTYPLYFNYNPEAVVPSPCFDTVLGCMDPFAQSPDGANYNAAATSDDGTCIYYGCLDDTTPNGSGLGIPGALNYNPNATHQGTVVCTYAVLGCIDSTQFNYNALATHDDGSCVPYVYGCISDPGADNYAGVGNENGINPPANTDDPNNPCFTTVLGCIEQWSGACNYNPLANTDDGSCVYCGDTAANVNNYDGADPSCNTGCLYCTPITNLAVTSVGYNDIDLSWTAPSAVQMVQFYSYNLTYENDTTGSSTTVNFPLSNNTWSITGLDSNTTYNISIVVSCANSTSGSGVTAAATTQLIPIYGCIDPNACNTAVGANTDDGSCEYVSCGGCTDPNACNYNSQATFDDGSCTLPPSNADCNGNCLAGFVLDNGSCVAEVFGCTDDSTNNEGTNTAANNYDPLATTDDGSCVYAMPTLWSGIPSGHTNSILLNTPGWWSSGLWGGGNYRRLMAIWDVSNSPKITDQILVSYLQSASTSNFSGDINFFSGPNNLWYSNDDGASWLPVSTWNQGDPIKLIKFQYNNSGVVNFTGSDVGNAVNYPPINTGTYTGEQQAMQIPFVNPSIPTYTTPPAIYYVNLGCNDSSAVNYTGPVSFYNNDTQCQTLGTIDNIIVNNNTWLLDPIYGLYSFQSTLQWDHTSGNYDPENYKIEIANTPGDGLEPLAGEPFYSSGPNNNPPYTGSNPETAPAPGISLSDPTGQWRRFRIRAEATVDGTVLFSPWFETWDQVQ